MNQSDGLFYQDSACGLSLIHENKYRAHQETYAWHRFLPKKCLKRGGHKPIMRFMGVPYITKQPG